MARGNKKWVGEAYETKFGNTLTVRGYFTKHGKGRLIMSCDRCSLDKELFPEGKIVTSLDSFNAKRCVCACNPKHRFDEEQHNIRVERRCKELGYEFKGYRDDRYQGADTYLILHNPVTGNTWDTTIIQSFLRLGTKDPEVYNSLRGQSCKLPDDYFINKFKLTGSFKEDTIFERLNSRSWRYWCPNCSLDEYVKAGVCEPWFHSSSIHLLEGKVTCRCKKNSFRWNTEQRQYQIKKILNDNMLGEFIGWGCPRGYTNGRSIVIWKCQGSNHRNETMFSNFIKRLSCEECSANGFKNHLPAYLYAVRWKGDRYDAIKIGITNLDVRTRIQSQNLKTELTSELLNVYHHEDGNVVEECEKMIKRSLNCNYLTKGVMGRGFTETLEYSEENINKVKEIISTFNLKEYPNDQHP